MVLEWRLWRAVRLHCRDTYRTRLHGGAYVVARWRPSYHHPRCSVPSRKIEDDAHAGVCCLQGRKRIANEGKCTRLPVGSEVRSYCVLWRERRYSSHLSKEMVRRP